VQESKAEMEVKRKAFVAMLLLEVLDDEEDKMKRLCKVK